MFITRATFPKLTFTLHKQYVIALLLLAVLNIIVGQFTNIDLMIEDYYFDANLHQFPWKNTWFAKDLMHGYVKYVITDIGRLLILIVLLDLIYPWKIISQWQRIRLRFVAVAAVVIPSIIALLKHYSSLHCPWGIDRYGGSAPFVRLLDAMPSGVQAGKCFPAGHSTVGLWLAALCVFWLPTKPKTAYTVFVGGLSAGFTLGWVQQMRGAHFLFHTLWSVWIAACVIAVMLSFSKPLNKL
jgi:membrane-associated PAP2 superfamily phosphatase